MNNLTYEQNLKLIEIKKRLGLDSYSDHIVLLKAFMVSRFFLKNELNRNFYIYKKLFLQKWKESIVYNKEKEFCEENFIISSTMHIIESYR